MEPGSSAALSWVAPMIPPPTTMDFMEVIVLGMDELRVSAEQKFENGILPACVSYWRVAPLPHEPLQRQSP